MSYTVISHYAEPRTLAKIHDVGIDRPWRWLAAGWDDMRRTPATSIGYGVWFVIASGLVTVGLAMSQVFYLLVPLLLGFFLVAPALGIGLYQMSRRSEHGDPASLADALHAILRCRFQVSTMGAALMLILLAWIMTANLIFALLSTGVTPTPAGALPYLFSASNIPLLAIGCLAGATFALTVFGATVVAVPMLLDREDVDALSAMQTSLAAFHYNWRPLLLWAAIIFAVILGGFITLYVGLAVGFPVLGHASWHAYRDLIGE